MATPSSSDMITSIAAVIKAVPLQIFSHLSSSGIVVVDMLCFLSLTDASARGADLKRVTSGKNDRKTG